MRLKKVTVHGLYRTFDHEIQMDNPEGVTIIHGPNGFGKTVMLKMIAGVCEGDFRVFHATPFSDFRMDFDDGTAVCVARTPDERGLDPAVPAGVKLTTIDASGRPKDVVAPLLGALSPEVLDKIDDFIPGPYQLAGNSWLDRTTGRRYSLIEMLKRFPKARAALPSAIRVKLKGDEVDGLGDAVDYERLPVFVVEANRLGASASYSSPRQRSLPGTESDDERTFSRVRQYSDEIVQLIKTVLGNYAKSSQERDRTFPERLVQFIRQHKEMLGEREILDQMQELEKKRQRLIALGFLDSEAGLSDLTEDDVRKVQEALTIYVADVHTKLSAFDEMSQRVGKLIDIINERYEYKTVRLHRERGFCVVSHLGDNISLTDLSSGEQHELVLLYELLFNTPTNGLILVDEPEISLHVAWQSRFLSDLIDIVKLNGAYAVVATHSPVIIGNEWNLTKQLVGPRSNQEAKQR